MLQKLYGWTLEKAAHPQAFWWLVVLSFTEATFFPIPADAMLIPMIIAVRAKAWKLAAACTVASSAGGCFGWMLGSFAFEDIGKPLLELYGAMDKMAIVKAEYEKYGEFFVAMGAITPIPYKVVTVASGFFQMDFLMFTLVSILGRGARYFAIAGALYLFGPMIKDFADKNLKLALTICVFLFLGGFALVAWVL